MPAMSDTAKDSTVKKHFKGLELISLQMFTVNCQIYNFMRQIRQTL